MAGMRNVGWFILAFALAVSAVPDSAAAGKKKAKAAKENKTEENFNVGVVNSTTPMTHKVYPLAELGMSDDLAEWVVKSLPEMVRPGTWKSEGRSLTYYAPGRMLVICHEAEVQEEVAMLLAEMGRAAPSVKGKPAMPGRLAMPAMAAVPGMALMPAQYVTPAPSRLAEPRAAETEAAKSKPADGPRHLFHIILEGLDVGSGESVKLKNFTLRYEGEGIIDSNIVDLLKHLNKAGTLNGISPGLTLPSGQCPRGESSVDAETPRAPTPVLPTGLSGATPAFPPPSGDPVRGPTPSTTDGPSSPTPTMPPAR